MTSEPFVLGPGKGQEVTYLGGVAVFKIDAEQTGGWGVFQETFPAGFATAVHVHHTEDGAFFVLDGEMLVRCGERAFEAPAGAFVFLPRGVPHSFRVVGKQPASWLNIQGPTGDFARFAKETGEPVSDSQSIVESSPRIDAQARGLLAQKYGLEIVGPPPPYP